jgi:GNAT superfamily N-acetyltransferase
MDIEAIIRLYDQQERFLAEFPGATRDVVPPVVRQINLPGRRSFIIHSALTEATADAVIAREAVFFERLARDVEWKVFSHDAPPDLAERLQRAGFVVEDVETVMICDLNALPPRLQAAPTADIRSIEPGPALDTMLDDLLSVENTVWEADMSWLREHIHEQLRDYPGTMNAYIAYQNGLPASAAWISFPSRSAFASLFGGSTLPQFRGQGLYTQLVAVRAQEARSRGYRYLTIDASDMSRAVLEKQGFVAVATAMECVRKVINTA